MKRFEILGIYKISYYLINNISEWKEIEYWLNNGYANGFYTITEKDNYKSILEFYSKAYKTSYLEKNFIRFLKMILRHRVKAYIHGQRLTYDYTFELNSFVKLNNRMLYKSKSLRNFENLHDLLDTELNCKNIDSSFRFQYLKLLAEFHSFLNQNKYEEISVLNRLKTFYGFNTNAYLSLFNSFIKTSKQWKTKN